MPAPLPPVQTQDWDAHQQAEYERTGQEALSSIAAARSAQDAADQAAEQDFTQRAQAQVQTALAPHREAEAAASFTAQAQEQVRALTRSVPAVPQQDTNRTQTGQYPGDTGSTVSSDPLTARSGAVTASDPNNLQDYARAAAIKAGIDPETFVRQIQQESGFDPTARNASGATGIAQIVPSAHPGVDPTDPRASLDYAANWMGQLTKQYGGDKAKALAAYNAGPGNVEKYGGVPPFEETQRYVRTILGAGGDQGDAALASSTAGPPQQAGPQIRTGPPGQSTRVEAVGQFEQDLSAEDAYSICGPVAALAFAQANGRNPDLGEARRLAKQVGWTSEGGMNGVANEAKLLQQMGVSAKLDQNPDFGHIAEDAASGNPVIISTPVHYYFVNGYDKQTGQLHVGKTGEARKGGGSWMSAQQIATLDGGINGALFVDNPQSPTPSVGASEPASAEPPLDDQEPQAAALTSQYQPGGAVGGSFADQTVRVPGTGLDQPASPDLVGAAGTALDAGGDALVGQVERSNADYQAWRDASRAIIEKQQRGEPVSQEEYGRVVEMAAPYALAMTGEPLAKVGGDAVGAVAGKVARSLDPDLARIQSMYDAKPTAAITPIAERLDAVRRTLVRQWTDRGVDLAEFQAKAQQALGRPLQADEMAYELARLNPDMAAKVRVDEGLRPILQAAGDDYPAVRDYLTAKGNLDVATAKGNAERAFSGGMDAASSQRALDALERDLGPERFAKVQALSEDVATFNRDLLQRKVDAGLITPKQFAQWTTDYPTYTPVKITDYLKDTMNGGTGQGTSLSVRSNGIKVLSEEGTSRVREDPLASTLRNAYETEALVKRNNAFNAFNRLRDADPTLQAQIREVPNGFTASRNQQTVTGFVKGERKTFVMPADMAAVVKQEGSAPVPIIGPLMQLFKMAVTSRNPAFLAGNAINDAVSYVLRTSAREGGPQHAPRILADLGKAYVDAFSGLLSGEFRGDTARFLREGGGQFGFFQRSEAGAKAGVEALRRSTILNVENAGDLGRLARDLVTLKPVETLGERIELAPRVAAFRRAERAGRNTTQAVLAGRTVTIDFAQGGSVAKVLNGFVPFFNVGMQAAATPARALAENPRGAVLTAAGLLVAPTVAAEAWNNADEQRARDYADVPNYLKDQGVVVMLPGEAPVDDQGNRRPQFVHIKLRDYAPLISLSREIAKKVVGGEPRDWLSLLGGAGGSVLPVTGASQLVAPGVSTAVQLQANRDLFRGSDIATPARDEAAASLSSGVASAINAAASAVGRYPDVRPSQVDFAARDLGGGVANLALSASNLLTGKATRGGTPQDMPGLGAFIARGVRSDIGQTAQDARDARLSPESLSALYDAGLKPDVAVVKGDIDGAKLTRQEQATYQRLANDLVEQAIFRVSSRSKWDAGSTADKEAMLREALAGAHAKAKAQMTSEVGRSELRSRARESADRKAG